MKAIKVINVETDVLVVSGGLAGCMAAIKAAEKRDLRVTMVDKANTLASGCAGSGIDHLWSYIPPVHGPMGYTIEDMAEDHRVGVSGGLMRKDLFMLVAGSMYERVLDLESFGINFRYEDSTTPGKFRIVPQFHSVPTSFNFDGKPLKVKLTMEAKRRKVKIINRVQMVDLIVTDGQISGAVGLGTRTGDLYFFRAKAVVLASGKSTRLSKNPSGVDFNTRQVPTVTGDGAAMALRAGLSLVNSEFLGNRVLVPGANYNPNYGDPRNTVQPAAKIVDGEGNTIVPRTQFYDWAQLGTKPFDAAETRRKWLDEYTFWRKEKRALPMRAARGEGPFFLDLGEATDQEKDYIQWSIGNEGKGTQFLRYFIDEEGLDLRSNSQEYAGLGERELFGTSGRGLWVDGDTETDIRNLFAAGDEVGGLAFQSAPGAIAMGWHAGGLAAKRSKESKALLPASDDAVKRNAQLCRGMLNQKRGFHWREVEHYVQHVVDFYCGSSRGEKMLQRGLERLQYAREKGDLRAENPHELARSFEVLSIIENAELIIRASIERKESRRSHGFARLEYPEQDDKNWLAFLAIKKESDNYVCRKIPVDVSTAVC